MGWTVRRREWKLEFARCCDWGVKGKCRRNYVITTLSNYTRVINYRFSTNSLLHNFENLKFSIKISIVIRIRRSNFPLKAKRNFPARNSITWKIRPHRVWLKCIFPSAVSLFRAFVVSRRLYRKKHENREWKLTFVKKMWKSWVAVPSCANIWSTSNWNSPFSITVGPRRANFQLAMEFFLSEFSMENTNNQWNSSRCHGKKENSWKASSDDVSRQFNLLSLWVKCCLLLISPMLVVSVVCLCIPHPAALLAIETRKLFGMFLFAFYWNHSITITNDTFTRKRLFPLGAGAGGKKNGRRRIRPRIENPVGVRASRFEGLFRIHVIDTENFFLLLVLILWWHFLAAE